MMDHERTEKELQEIFEEIQRSYAAFADDAFALQERILGFARGLLESPAGEGEGPRDTLGELTDRSRAERERFARLARSCDEAFTKVLRDPADEHHHKIEEARSDLREVDSE